MPRDQSPLRSHRGHSPCQPDYSPQRRPANFDKVEQSALVDALKQIVFCERETESAKIELALKSDFNLVDAFRMLDIRNLGSFTANDLIEGLTQFMGFHDFSQDDIELFFRKFDRTQRGRMTMAEFSAAFLPFSKEYSSLVIDRVDYYSKRGFNLGQYFNSETRFEMRTVWGAIFKAEKAMEQLRLSLAKRPYFNGRQAFEFCSRLRPG
jgi:hypothetical protein